MNIDFSIFKNIDLTNKDTLIFLSIFLVIAAVIFSVFIIIVRKIIKIIKRAIVRISDRDVKKTKFGQNDQGEDLDVVVKELEKSKEERAKAEQQKIAAAAAASPKLDYTNYSVKPELKVSENIQEPKILPKSENLQKDFSRGEIKIPTSKHSPAIEENKTAGSSIFKGEAEVSKTKLEHEMRTDTGVWQAARKEGLTLSPIERAKLVKEVFSPAYGMNISKTDLKSGIKKLNQEMLGTKDTAEHAKIRKEIKFLKRAGGIK
jgi:ABC-type Na+ efflux pump permease subunit